MVTEKLSEHHVWITADSGSFTAFNAKVLNKILCDLLEINAVLEITVNSTLSFNLTSKELTKTNCV